MKIPVITNELGFAITADLSQKGRTKLLEDIYATIKEENPQFYKQLQMTAYVTLQTGSERDQIYIEGVLEGMGLMYKIISSQMEADEMNKAWGSEGEKE